MTINIVLKVSFLKLRSTHCRSLCNIILIKLCGKSITRLPGQGCSKYLCFFSSRFKTGKVCTSPLIFQYQSLPLWMSLWRLLVGSAEKSCGSQTQSRCIWTPLALNTWSIEVCTCVTYTQVTALLIEIHFFETTYFPQSREIEIKTTLRFVWRPVLLSLPS